MRLTKEYWIAIICKLCVIITEFLITVFINRGLGIYVKGEYSYIIKVVEVLYIFFSFGIGQTYSTFKRSKGEDMKNLFVALGLSHTILIILFGGLYIFLVKPEYGISIVLLTAIAVLKVIVSMIAVIEKSITRNVLQAVINSVYMIGLFLLYISRTANLITVLFCYGISDVIRIVILMVLYKMKPSLKGINKEIIKAIYITGFITMLVMLLTSINYSVDTIMLKKMTSSYHTGIYSVGVSLANMFLLIPDAFKEVLFGDSTRKDFSQKTAFSAIKVSLLISVVVLIGFLMFGKWFISLFYGIDYLPSYTVTLILFLGCFSLVLFKILQPIYISHGKQTRAAFFLMCSAIANIVANFFVIPKYNENGAAIASVLSYTICGLLFLLDYLRMNKIGSKNIH